MAIDKAKWPKGDELAFTKKFYKNFLKKNVFLQSSKSNFMNQYEFKKYMIQKRNNIFNYNNFLTNFNFNENKKKRS